MGGVYRGRVPSERISRVHVLVGVRRSDTARVCCGENLVYVIEKEVNLKFSLLNIQVRQAPINCKK